MIQDNSQPDVASYTSFDVYDSLGVLGASRLVLKEFPRDGGHSVDKLKDVIKKFDGLASGEHSKHRMGEFLRTKLGNDVQDVVTAAKAYVSDVDALVSTSSELLIRATGLSKSLVEPNKKLQASVDGFDSKWEFRYSPEGTVILPKNQEVAARSC